MTLYLICYNDADIVKASSLIICVPYVQPKLKATAVCFLSFHVTCENARPQLYALVHARRRTVTASG